MFESLEQSYKLYNSPHDIVDVNGFIQYMDHLVKHVETVGVFTDKKGVYPLISVTMPINYVKINEKSAVFSWYEDYTNRREGWGARGWSMDYNGIVVPNKPAFDIKLGDVATFFFCVDLRCVGFRYDDAGNAFESFKSGVKFLSPEKMKEFFDFREKTRRKHIGDMRKIKRLAKEL